MQNFLPAIILASQSPRRKELLELVGIDFEIILPNVEEDYPNTLPYQQITSYLAQKKAQAVFQNYPHTEKIILAADTLVFLNEQTISKPKDLSHAKEILQNLSGKKHEVITSICLINKQKKIIKSCLSEVFFNELSETQINYYVDTYKPLDKAGAYAIDEWIGAVAINLIKGDFYSIKGLPINIVIKELSNW